MENANLKELCERLYAQGTPDATRAAALLEAVHKSNAHLNEQSRIYWHTHNLIVERKASDWLQQDDADDLYAQGYNDALTFVLDLYAEEDFSPEGLVRD